MNERYEKINALAILAVARLAADLWKDKKALDELSDEQVVARIDGLLPDICKIVRENMNHDQLVEMVADAALQNARDSVRKAIMISASHNDGTPDMENIVKSTEEFVAQAIGELAAAS